jgi:hypothetical protein
MMRSKNALMTALLAELNSCREERERVYRMNEKLIAQLMKLNGELIDRAMASMDARAFDAFSDKRKGVGLSGGYIEDTSTYGTEGVDLSSEQQLQSYYNDPIPTLGKDPNFKAVNGSHDSGAG